MPNQPSIPRPSIFRFCHGIEILCGCEVHAIESRESSYECPAWSLVAEQVGAATGRHPRDVQVDLEALVWRSAEASRAPPPGTAELNAPA